MKINNEYFIHKINLYVTNYYDDIKRYGGKLVYPVLVVSNELKNGFDVKDNIYLIKNKNVILIDDIFTTGSTANEISKLLKLNSVNNIYIFTLLTTYADSYIKE